MWFNFSDLDRTFAAFDALQREINGQPRRRSFQARPRVVAQDDGDAWTVSAELPGIPADAVELTLTGQVLRISARRPNRSEDEKVVHRTERNGFELVRSLTLPHKVDGEKVTARARNGIFTVHLPKAADARPRNITVQAA